MSEFEKKKDREEFDEQHGVGAYAGTWGSTRCMLRDVQEFMESLNAEGYETRLVFWFDS